MDAPNPLALCQLETIEVLVGTERRNRSQKVTAHRYLDFAVHRSLEDESLFAESWVITHVPSGRSAAHAFRSIDTAAAAMIEIARLRNDWAEVDDDAAKGESAKRAEEVIKRHDARARLGAGRKGTAIKNVMNGYGSA